MHMQNGRGVASRTPHACLCAAHSSSTAADRCADALGAAVLHCLCQEEAQDAIDPSGIAVNKLGFLLIHVGSGKSLLVLPRKVLHWRER